MREGLGLIRILAEWMFILCGAIFADMAAKSEARDRLYEPSPREGHCSCCIGENFYILFGDTRERSNDAKLSQQVEVFNAHFKTWAQRKTAGTPPPGLFYSACALIGSRVYHYGGVGHDSPFTGTLGQLDTITMEWKLLTSESDTGPMKKRGAGMVGFHRDKLALFGGYGIRPTSPAQPGASFVKDWVGTDGLERGYTNEFHLFNISNGNWSSPPMTGSRPPPCVWFTFTTVDENRAVVFGGYQPGRGYVNDIYIIDFNDMNWTKIEPRVGESWPVGRRDHAACCLDHGGEYPQLLISGGTDNGHNVPKDCWMFDMISRKWKKLTLPDDVKTARYDHSITASISEPGLVEVVMFGGKDEVLLSATLIMRFKFIVSTREWDLVDVVTNRQRAVEVENAKEDQRHYEAYQQALQSGVSVDIKYLKMLMLGPPRAGKTSLRRRLIGEIIHLIDQAIQPSTGTVDAQNIVVKLTEEKMTNLAAAISETTWTAVGHGADKSDLDEELHLLYQFISEGSVGLTNTVSDEPQPLASQSVQESQESTESQSQNDGFVSGMLKMVLNKFYWKKPMPSQEAHAINATVMVSHDTEEPDLEWERIERALEAFNTALESLSSRQQLKFLLEKTILLNMVDTGGQLAFIEMLPMLTIGPALYLIFLRLDQELKQRYKIQYISEDNEELSLGESSYTCQEVIFQVLSSIACFRADTSSTTSAPDKPQITSQQSQAAMLVGTYKDKLEGSPEEVQSKIKQIDRALQEELKEILDTDLFEADRNLLRYASDDQLMFDVDNMTGSEDEVKKIRKRLEEVILQDFNEVPIPGSWLMFGLFLRRMGRHLVSLSHCEEIGRRLHVNDVREAIWFLHHCIGVLMYYPDVEELKDVVICDPQIVFDSVTELILNTFKLKAVRKAACDKFKLTGQFSFNDIKKLSKALKSRILPLSQLIKLLEYLYIIARISYSEESGAASTEAPQSASVVDVRDENVVYFMPSVLPSAKESELNVSHSPVDPAPLLIRFKSGIVPVGLFCASIASLVARKKLGWTVMEPQQSGSQGASLTLKLSSVCLYKNRVTFRVNRYSGSYNVTLISKPKRYEVHIQTISSPVDRPRHYICQHVLNTVCQILDHVISKMKHKQYLALSSSNSPTQSPYELGFQCPLHPDEDHMAVCRPYSEQGEPSLSADVQWFAYFESSNTALLCLDENVVVPLTNSQTHDTLSNPQAGDSSLQHGEEGLENSHVGGVSVCDKYGLWIVPRKVAPNVPLTYLNVTTSLKTLVDWHKLGVMLEIEKSTLDSIRIDYFHLGMERQRDQLVDVWLRNDTQASWSKLCRALEAMGERVLSREIQSKYCGMSL